ncbi:MAG: hypothetical protein DMF80_05685 [Acidobacteria bacterium]|nr:MAG: hypothetical protein DMF80_05685 [Acidobacteriota bacterium]
MPTSLVLAGVFAAGLGKGPGIAWSKDYTRAFAEAEERRAPLLVHFRGANCGRTTVPGATESRGGSRGDGITRPLHDNVPVLVGPGDETLNTRYQVIVNPTTLFLDPWGNEIFRVSGYLERAKFSRILQAVPTDFAPLAAAGRGLREKPDDLAALAAVAAFYESQRLRQVSERLYERAQAAPAAAGDLASRRQVAIARGLNLLMMGKAREAESVFEKALDAAPDAPGSDALLLGVVNAHLEAGHRREAETAYRRLQQAYPASPYTARARQNLEAARSDRR